MSEVYRGLTGHATALTSGTLVCSARSPAPSRASSSWTWQRR